MTVPAWGHRLQTLHEFVLPRAGAIPTREEIVTWYGELSLSRWGQELQAKFYGIPYLARLTLGLLLCSAGLLILWKSYQRVRRPSQAEVVRRVARAARSATEPIVAEQEMAAETLAFAEKPATGRPLMVGPRPPLIQSFFTAEQIEQGRAPWAVPLSHDLLRIGRHQENDIQLEDKTVHRYHALLHRSPDGDFLIRDLSGQTGNGVYVNGARIEQTQLRPGDLVELGAVRLRFQQQRPS